MVLQRQRILIRMGVHIRHGIRQCHDTAVHAAVVCFVKDNVLTNGHRAVSDYMIGSDGFHIFLHKRKEGHSPPLA